LDELISILSHEEQTMKKGKDHIVQYVSYQNAEKKKKDFLIGKTTEVSFKSHLP